MATITICDRCGAQGSIDEYIAPQPTHPRDVAVTTIELCTECAADMVRRHDRWMDAPVEAIT